METSVFDRVYGMYTNASVSSGNMASCIGILNSVNNNHEEFLEQLWKSTRNKEVKNSIERQLQICRRSMRIANYYWDNRNIGKSIDWNEAVEAVNEMESKF